MKIVESLMKEGVDKKEIFKIALEEGLPQKKVSRNLAIHPDKDIAKKYSKANFLLLCLYSVMVLIGLLSVIGIAAKFSLGVIAGLLCFSMLIPSFIIYSIFNNQSIGYFLLCFFLFKGILDSVKFLESNPKWFLIGVIVNLAMLVFVVILKKKMFPYQNFFNSKKTSEGVYVFSNNM